MHDAIEIGKKPGGIHSQPPSATWLEPGRIGQRNLIRPLVHQFDRERQIKDKRRKDQYAGQNWPISSESV